MYIPTVYTEKLNENKYFTYFKLLKEYAYY